jgi:hypothetical protein
MPGPIVFISHNRIKPGRLEALRDFSHPVFDRLKAEKPATAAFLGYVSADGQEASFIHVFADARGFERHVEDSEERGAAALEFIESRSVEIYGEPGETVMPTFSRMAEAGVILTLNPVLLGGYLRLSTS